MDAVCLCCVPCACVVHLRSCVSFACVLMCVCVFLTDQCRPHHQLRDPLCTLSKSHFCLCLSLSLSLLLCFSWVSLPKLRMMTMARNCVEFAALAVAAALLTAAAPAAAASAKDESTWSSLQHNVLSYLILIIPAAILIRYVRQNPNLIQRTPPASMHATVPAVGLLCCCLTFSPKSTTYSHSLYAHASLPASSPFFSVCVLLARLLACSLQGLLCSVALQKTACWAMRTRRTEALVHQGTRLMQQQVAAVAAAAAVARARATATWRPTGRPLVENRLQRTLRGLRSALWAFRARTSRGVCCRS